MKSSGRVSLVALLSVVAIGIFVSVFFFSKESLSSVGGRFMTALAKGDVDTLTKMSYSNKSPEEIRKEWDYTVHKAGKNYNFLWRILSATQADKDTASIRVGVTGDPANGSSYEQNYGLPLVKVGDEWKVDIKGINREMYPFLPR